MAEKGGKGFSLPPKGGKSSIKSSPLKEASIKGKDDSSTKKKGRKVQFDSEAVNFSSKSGGKDSPSTFPKGKGDKGASGGKGSVTKVPQPLELRIEQELPKNAKCLMACEAAEILEGIQDRMTTLSKDPSIKIPVSFDKGLQYAKRGSHYTNTQSVRRSLETLTKYSVTDGEICVIANVCPDNVDEAFALIPSLKAKRSIVSDPLNDVLIDLAMVKK
ncbi:hypothetical protein FEM48_Zijuj01G0090900 [Ziziphus jujuba var. spinosa]|uniref:RNA polymerase Rpb4/RPC9 core domain-containing protein n=1 Tax=Ziziphus jujuba var. spinosa TaxID=714518 RepID=A0A978W0C8_ZIZJJ|nr:DNA-directed RNA polymerases IV and V subunit 4-like [Ziziphus jujuba var. spinosa]KAH7545412.1 hypothetical protein FEM48_Zijuj01G0090900 [Ziziphus jujuba var. spinosa]